MIKNDGSRFQKTSFCQSTIGRKSRFDFGDEINRGGFKDFVGPQKSIFIS
jgi:hypothetical protein